MIASALPDSSHVAAGMILAGGYRILKEINASDHGRMFRAERIDDNSAVAALILQPALPSRSKEFIRLEQEVNSLRQLKAPAFQQILAVECTDAQTFLILEWIEGPSLLDLLRTRRAFPISEAQLLLFPLAEAFDELRSTRPGLSRYRGARNPPARSRRQKARNRMAGMSAEVFTPNDGGFQSHLTGSNHGCLLVCSDERKGSLRAKSLHGLHLRRRLAGV